MNIFSRFSLVATITATTAFMLVFALGLIAFSVSFAISSRIEDQAIDGQDTSLRVSATIIEREIPGTKVSWTKDGNVDRILMEKIPQEFTSHDMIDSIGRMTGQTATIFAWDADSKDFWRRTTNIIKPDGKRAVGTQLGQTGAVYPYAIKGETYRGEAVILGTPYYTIYKPIFSPKGGIIGILYAGVRSDEIKAIAGQINWYLGVLSTFVVIAAIVSMTLIARKVMGPIPKLTNVATALAAGKLDITVPHQKLNNEIGGIARAIDVLRQEAVAKKTLEHDAVQSRTLKDEEARQAAGIEKAKTQAMVEATTGLGEGLKHLADGDLSFQLVRPFSPEYEALRSDFNSAVTQLSQTMISVAEAVGGIDNGSREISLGTNDLSKRTEQQAATLEETAAALDEITANVSNSSKRADEARGVAAQANISAAHSGKVVANAVEAMGRIEQSSTQIATIIGVIDEIAFQTNLLALNAGVEAARAGDAGKGFAVVAQEVRELAQRSAKAAKEIKDLIRNSGVEVQSGVALVSETGEALRTIEAYIITVNQHMDAIASSAKEQSVGLGEINNAVNQMDHVTQQNAAMVEETSAASANLATESNRLLEIISQFNLGSNKGATLGSNRPARSPQMASPERPTTVHPPVLQVVRRAAGSAAIHQTWEEL